MRTIYIILFSIIIFSCSKKIEKTPVVISLLGKSYFEPERSEKSQGALDSNLNVAKSNFEKDASENNYIWYGRRLGYFSRFQEAIDVFTEGISKYPASAKLYRHRGHRYISLRQFSKATEDLKKADELSSESPIEIEPDGSPNKLNIPLSTTQFNSRYHLGLAFYLQEDFKNAEQSYQSCLLTCNNDDLMIATIDWLYMTYKREGKEQEASKLLDNVLDSMNIVENDSYYKRCMMYKGKISPDSLLKVSSDENDPDLALATQGYGVGNWYLYNGDSAKAKEIFEKVVAGKHFSAFGFIASEAELARWK
ncbi:MAG: hypothetical protein HOP08_14205 [Cyclobacteriaceae bacterium]|nr:hypothetical protein [Cyclobacteriaceae bacterium]